MLRESDKPVVGTWFKENGKRAVAAHAGWLMNALWLAAAAVVGWLVGIWSV